MSRYTCKRENVLPCRRLRLPAVAGAQVSASDLAHEQVDLRVDRQVLQLAGVARQLHQQAAEGDEYVHTHLRAPR